MNFERYCGMASAVALILIFAIVVWTGLWGPLWQDVKAPDILNLIVAVVGWIVTLGIGVRAFALSQRQILLANTQIALQQIQMDQQQLQIEQARQDAKHSSYARLERESQAFGAEIDRLVLVPGYLRQYTDLFPTAGTSGWSMALYRARQNAQDAISYSATAAPFGYGERVSTLMTRVHRLGDRLVEANFQSGAINRTTFDQLDPFVKASIDGIRSMISEIEGKIPKLRSQLTAIADERDTYA